MDHTEQPKSSAKGTPRVSAACVYCRSKHVRCDAKQPECGRCLSDGKQCQYVKSRRGGLFRAQLAAYRNRSFTATQSPSSRLTGAATLLPESTSHYLTSKSELHHVQPGNGPDLRLEGCYLPQSETSSSTHVDGSPKEQLHVEPHNIAQCAFLDLYYRYFHKCHPCVLPRRCLLKRYGNETEQKRMNPLISVMRYIGSLFAGSSLSSQLSQLARKEIWEAQNHLSNSFVVQSHLIYSIALFWCGDKIQSREHMDAAIRTALDLAMFSHQFAVENGEGDAILQESWRRTWWQLYVADATFAAIRRETAFPTRDLDISVELPCEEEDYEAGVIPTPKTLEDFENREFAHEPHVYSSFAYLIGATRCAVSAAAVVPSDVSCWNSSKVLAEVDAITDGWKLLLPESKREILGKDGQVDELMFQAQMSLNTTIIVLHRPFSELLFHPLESISTCSTGPPPHLPTQESVIVHNTRCLQAIETQVRFMTLPSQPLRHTPFTICMVNEAAIPLLSACKFLFTGQKLSVARSQLRLLIGSLKSLTKAWRRAAINMQELQAIAREVLPQRTQERTGPSPGNIPQDGGGVEPIRTSDSCLLENWSDMAMSPVSLTSFDAFWAADVQTEVPTWSDYL